MTFFFLRNSVVYFNLTGYQIENVIFCDYFFKKIKFYYFSTVVVDVFEVELNSQFHCLQGKNRRDYNTRTINLSLSLSLSLSRSLLTLSLSLSLSLLSLSLSLSL